MGARKKENNAKGWRGGGGGGEGWVEVFAAWVGEGGEEAAQGEE